MPFQLEQKLAWISGATVPRLKVTRDVSLLPQARSLKHLVKARTKTISPVGSETMEHTPQFWWRDVLWRLYSFGDAVFQQFATEKSMFCQTVLPTVCQRKSMKKAGG